MQNHQLWVEGGGGGRMGPLVTVTLSVKRLLGVSWAAVEDRTRFGGVTAGDKSYEISLSACNSWLEAKRVVQVLIFFLDVG